MSYHTKSFFAAAAFALASSTAFGQMLEPRDADVTMDDQQYSGVSVMLAASPDEVRDALEDWADDTYDIDLDYKGGLIGRDKTFLITKDAYNIPVLGERPAYLNAHIVESGDGSELTMFATYEGNVAIMPTGSYMNEFAGVRQLTDEFLEDFVPAYYRDRVSTTENTVEEINDDISDFNEDIRDNEEKIEKLKQENEELRQNIVEAKQRLKNTNTTLEDREEQLEEAVEKVDDGM